MAYPGQSRRLVPLLLIALLIGTLATRYALAGRGPAVACEPSFVTSVDTMKESKDTARAPLTDAQIAATVTRAVTLNVAYIAVATDWDVTPDYLRAWVRAVRAAHKHVWFRIHPAQWENDYDTTGVMSPEAYLTALDRFIATTHDLFAPGDILDPCPEPENGKYWSATFGAGWDSVAQRTAATDAYNHFILDGTRVADAALARAGIGGVTDDDPLDERADRRQPGGPLSPDDRLPRHSDDRQFPRIAVG